MNLELQFCSTMAAICAKNKPWFSSFKFQAKKEVRNIYLMKPYSQHGHVQSHWSKELLWVQGQLIVRSSLHCFATKDYGPLQFSSFYWTLIVPSQLFSIILCKKIFNNKILCTSCLDSRDEWRYFFFKISVTYYGAVSQIVFQHKDF